MSLIDKLPRLRSYASLRLVMKAVSDALLSRTLWGLSCRQGIQDSGQFWVMMSENPVLLWSA